ncbi:PilZ domain-containing protein [Azospirillum sp.]|uniref:PilZ domain-containing protein n=1 Tax=Azospirillum sp. TaxID=34012 RepID=UPI002D58EF87|nr:PilZ domain-containing protein [Azospirillum sp.]HYD70760.1 PilZ domain-containing protein [Azospirillum sp.]
MQQSLLVRVVRTSTNDADRRRQKRYDVEERVSVTAGGRAQACRVVNLSAGGAMIAGLPADGAPFARGTLRLDGHGGGRRGQRRSGALC